MTLDEYQQVALKTAKYTGDEFMDLMHWILGMAGEAGEVADKAKKIIRDKKGQIDEADKQELLKEAGDVLWHVAVLADHFGVSLEEVAQQNADKLADRQKRNAIHGAGDSR